MSNEAAVLKTFSSEIAAEIAQQILQENGVHAFMFKDDAGGMEPHLQQTNGVRLLVNQSDAARAKQILEEVVSL